MAIVTHKKPSAVRMLARCGKYGFMFRRFVRLLYSHLTLTLRGDQLGGHEPLRAAAEHRTSEMRSWTTHCQQNSSAGRRTKAPKQYRTRTVLRVRNTPLMYGDDDRGPRHTL